MVFPFQHDDIKLRCRVSVSLDKLLDLKMDACLFCESVI